MAYNVIIRKSASKQLRLLPHSIVPKVASAIDDLADDPRPTNCKKLKGVDNTYRIRVSDYRVIYTVDDNNITVEVIKIGNRKDIYD